MKRNIFSASSLRAKRNNLISLLILLFSGTVSAQQDFHLSLEPVFGMKNGRINEYVYNNTSSSKDKLSELNWDIKNSFYAGGKFELSYSNFAFNFSAAGVIPAASGNLQDSDWQNDSDHSMKTNYSISDNYIRNSYNIGSQFIYTLPIVKFFEIKFLSDLTFEHFYFEGKDGEGWYGDSKTMAYYKGITTDGVAWNDSTAVYFSKGHLGSITYDRNSWNFSIGIEPYFNICNLVKIGLYGNISPFVYNEANDIHKSTDGAVAGNYLDSGSTFFNSWNAGGFVEVDPFNHFAFKAEFSYSSINFYKGKTSSKSSNYYTESDTALSGFSQHYTDLSISVIYRPF